MGLTRRKDSFYVEFRVIDDGKHLRPSASRGGEAEALESWIT